MQEESLRIQKLNQLITEEVGKILLREVDISRENLITITSVKTSYDFRNSTIYITVLPEDKEEEALNQINKQIYFIQKILNRTLRTKPIPRLRFEIDRITKAEQKVYEDLEKIEEELPPEPVEGMHS